MFWQSIMADRLLELDELQAAVSNVFALDEAKVQATDDVLELTGPIPEDPTILIERILRDGPFPLQFDMFLGGADLEASVSDLASTLARVRGLAKLLAAALLIGDGPVGNLERLRIQPEGTVDIVEVDDNALDEDRFVIVGMRGFPNEGPEARMLRPARASAHADRRTGSNQGG